MKKRIIASSFVLILLLSSMMSCSDNKVKESDSVKSETTVSETVAETAPETTEYIKDDLEDTDLKGYNFRILTSYNDNRSGGEYITYDELTGDILNDALYNSTLSVEERFNCDISMIKVEDRNGFANKSIGAGENAFEMTVGHDLSMAEMSKSGKLYNLFDIPQFNFEKPWWPKNTIDNLSIGEKMYVASSYLSFCGLHSTRIIVTNKDKMADYGIEMPYQTVLDGKWTLDKMISMVKDVAVDLNGDGKMEMEDDFFGFATGDCTWICMQDSVGLTPYEKDKDGNFVLSIDLEKADKYAEMVADLMHNKCYIEEGFFGSPIFGKGNALIGFSDIEEIYNVYRESDFSYGILPTPKFDENQKEYISSCTDQLMGIPITAARNTENIDNIGTIIEALSCSNYNKVLPAHFEIVLSKKLSDAPEDAAMLNIIRDTRTIGFAYAYQMPFRNIADSCSKHDKNFSSLYATQQRLAEKSIEKLENAFEKLP